MPISFFSASDSLWIENDKNLLLRRGFYRLANMQRAHTKMENVIIRVARDELFDRACSIRQLFLIGSKEGENSNYWFTFVRAIFIDKTRNYFFHKLTENTGTKNYVQ